MALTKATYAMIQNAPANVLDFGTDSAAFQAAIAAADVIELPAGEFFVDAKITVPADKTLIIRGTLKPANNSVASGTPMIEITGSNVTVNFEGGGIDGISSSFKNWSGIVAGYQTTRLENIHVRNGLFQNIALTNTDMSVINFDGVSKGSMVGNIVKNCGTTTTLGGGSALYMQYCNQCLIENNVIDKVGATGITDSAGADNIITNNTLRYISLFGMKGGYAPNAAAVTGDVSPTVFTFSINASAATRRNFVPGVACTTLNANVPLPIAFISAVVDNGSYLQVFVNKPMVAAPDVGAQVQLLSKGTIFANNTVTQTGDNGWDYNGWCEITCVGNVLNECGAYTGAGTFGGLAAGFWFGYDPQAGYNKFRCEGLSLTENYINNTYGNGINIMATVDDIHIEGNTVINSNRRSDLAGSGIEVTVFSFYRSSLHSILNNTVIGYNNGVGINATFSSNDFISGNYIAGYDGIRLDAQNYATCANNYIRFTNNGGSGYGIKVSDAGGNNASTGIEIKNNTIYGPSSGFGIRNTDVNYSLSDVFRNNFAVGTGTFVAFSNNGGNLAAYQSMIGATFVERQVTQFLTGQTITFQRVTASTANGYLLAVQSEQSAASGLTGLYFISRSTTQDQITTISACADVTVAINGSDQITVQNTSGGDRTISAALSVVL